MLRAMDKSIRKNWRTWSRRWFVAKKTNLCWIVVWFFVFVFSTISSVKPIEKATESQRNALLRSSPNSTSAVIKNSIEKNLSPGKKNEKLSAFSFMHDETFSFLVFKMQKRSGPSANVGAERLIWTDFFQSILFGTLLRHFLFWFFDKLSNN